MMDWTSILINCGTPLLLIVIGFIAGHAAERSHMASLKRREEQLARVLMTDTKNFPGGASANMGAALVYGDAVIASDHFKTFLAKLRKIFGGEMRSYRSLMNRARREALARMLDSASAQGYDAVCNIRMEPANIGGTGLRAKGKTTVAVIATGTAYVRVSRG
jgi:uncharacterized protein YbjQ (UPF0145 family)